MAIDMQRKMKDLNHKWFERGVDENLQVRCGINTGMATVGGYGSSDRKEYTAMGMQVNIAARLEQACEPGGILLSHTTWALVKDEISCSERGQIDVKGFHKPIRIYSVDDVAKLNQNVSAIYLEFNGSLLFQACAVWNIQSCLQPRPLLLIG